MSKRKLKYLSVVGFRDVDYSKILQIGSIGNYSVETYHLCSLIIDDSNDRVAIIRIDASCLTGNWGLIYFSCQTKRF